MTKKKKAPAKKKKLRLDGKPKKKNRGRDPVIDDADVLNLEKCFELDYDITQALDETKVKRTTFYVRLKADKEFRNKMIAAKKRSLVPLKKIVMTQAAKNPWLALKVLERRAKKDWSPQISHDMKIAPVKIVFERPTKFFDASKADAPKEEDIEDMTDDDLFE